MTHRGLKQSLEALKQQGLRRDALLDRVKAVLYSDDRVLGAWLSGSFGRSEEDEWSDLDIQVAVEDRHFAAFLRDRQAVYAAVGDVLLIQEQMPSDNLTLGDQAIYQLVYFRDAVMVDWNVGPASEAQKPRGHRVMFEKKPFPVADPPFLTEAERRQQAQEWTTFFWAMAPIAVKYAARGATRQAARQSDLLTRALICLKRLASESAGPNPWLEWINRPLEEGIDGQLPRLGPVITPQSVLYVVRAQCELMNGMQVRLSELEVDFHVAMAEETERLMRIADAAVTADRGSS